MDCRVAALLAIIADDAAVRIIPAPGKSVGDIVDFGGLLSTAPVMPVTLSRSSRIPAPLESLRN